MAIYFLEINSVLEPVALRHEVFELSRAISLGFINTLNFDINLRSVGSKTAQVIVSIFKGVILGL